MTATLELLQAAGTWLVFPALAAILWAVGWRLRTKKATEAPPPKPVDTSKPDQHRTEVTEQADRDRVAELAKARASHEKAIENLTDEQRARYAELVEDPDELNAWLLEVGKKNR